MFFFSLNFNFDFLSTSQEIGWEERLRFDLFNVTSSHHMEKTEAGLQRPLFLRNRLKTNTL